MTASDHEATTGMPDVPTALPTSALPIPVRFATSATKPPLFMVASLQVVFRSTVARMGSSGQAGG